MSHFLYKTYIFFLGGGGLFGVLGGAGAMQGCLSVCVTFPEVTMGKTAKAKDNSKKSHSPRTLKDSFDKSKNKKGSPNKQRKAAATTAPSSPASSSHALEPSRTQRSNFLSYVRSAMASKSEEASHQAAYINAQYHQLSATEKKNLVVEFHKSGGRRQGLSCCYKQTMVVSQKATDGTWEGYLTFDGLCSKAEVTLGLGHLRCIHPIPRKAVFIHCFLSLFICLSLYIYIYRYLAILLEPMQPKPSYESRPNHRNPSFTTLLEFPR